jgi:hypothetical protein
MLCRLLKRKCGWRWPRSACRRAAARQQTPNENLVCFASTSHCLWSRPSARRGPRGQPGRDDVVLTVRGDSGVRSFAYQEVLGCEAALLPAFVTSVSHGHGPICTPAQGH